MSHICVVNLAGIPASGKTTFCHQLCAYVQANRRPYNIVHMDFDKFIQMPINQDREQYCQTKAFKKDRFRLRWIIQEFISGVKNKQSIGNVLEIVNVEYPGHDFQTNWNQKHSKYVFLIDDNMYYKSMRKEIRNICKELNVGYLVLYFESSLDGAIQRNATRHSTAKLTTDIIENISARFEVPISSREEATVVPVNIDEQSEHNFDSILAFIEESMQSPLTAICKPSHEAITPSRLHQIDLILRKEISNRIQSLNRKNNKSQFAAIFCQKRKQIMYELKLGILDFPIVLNDIKEYL